MSNIKTITLHTQEVRKDKQVFYTNTAEIRGKWYKIKFTKTCDNADIPHERGLYELKVDVDNLSLQRGKPYTDNQGKRVVNNDILWVKSVIQLRKYTDDDFKDANRIVMSEVFGD